MENIYEENRSFYMQLVRMLPIEDTKNVNITLRLSVRDRATSQQLHQALLYDKIR